MQRSKWTDLRLQRLYKHYNHKFWKSHLAFRKVVATTIGNENMGLCESRRVLIDLGVHRSDAEVRSTMLHEMCHVATWRGVSDAHGSAFFYELERLLRLKAPIRVTNAELGRRKLFLAVIPARFRLCRQRIRPIYKRQQRAIRREIREKNLEEFDLEDAVIVDATRAASRHGITWTRVRAALGRAYPLLDMDEKPLAGAKQILEKARAAHSKQLRDWRDGERGKMDFVAQFAVQPVLSKLVEDGFTPPITAVIAWANGSCISYIFDLTVGSNVLARTLGAVRFKRGWQSQMKIEIKDSTGRRGSAVVEDSQAGMSE